VRLEGGAPRHVPVAVPEVFTRGEQHAGLVLAELLLAVGLALLLAGMATFLGALAPPRRVWLGIVAAAAWATVALPAVEYPPLPPGVGSELPIGERQPAYLALVAAGLLGARAAAAAWRSGRLRPWAALLLLAPAAVAMLLLPGSRAHPRIPADLLRDFRIVAVAGQLLLYVGFALAGAWLLRPRRREMQQGVGDA